VIAYPDGAPRSITAGDFAKARELIQALLGGTPYIGRIEELLQETERGSTETRALVLDLDRSIVGLALFRPVAGTRSTWELDILLVASHVDPPVAVGRPLITAVADMARRGGGTLLMAELPADPIIGTTLTLLRANGFRQEARVPDFYRSGVARLLLRREL